MIKIIISVFLVSRMLISGQEVEIWNVLELEKTNSFSASPRMVSISSQGVESPLEGYVFSELTKDDALKYVDTASSVILQESLGLVDDRKSKKIRRIVFGLEKYRFQVYSCQKNSHRVVTLLALKENEKSDEDYSNKLVGMLGGGRLFFRVQIEYLSDQITDRRIILNQSF